MAEYDYEEGAFMALYFLLTFLVIVLIPLTWSLIPAMKTKKVEGCECSQCVDKYQRSATSTAASLFKFSTKGLIASALWVIFIAVAYKLATTTTESKIYDPFAILGLVQTDDEKTIKKHYKRLSLKFHPDKVKLAVNQTIEEVSAHFVNITKAYKALTDEAVRENLRLYGNPDGKQDLKVGIALPPWVIESSNNGYVLGAYGLLFGGLLPYFVGQWWFNSRQLTKDGVKGYTAQMFFKNTREEDSVQDLLSTLAKAWEYERPRILSSTSAENHLEEEIVGKMGKSQWLSIKKTSVGPATTALILLYAYFLRLPVHDKHLLREQSALLLRVPQFLSSILSITLAHNWQATTLGAMHLHSYFVQALLPTDDPCLQLPGVQREELPKQESLDVRQFVKTLDLKGDNRLESIRKSVKGLAILNVLDVHFKVIGERIITPGAIVQLIFKLRLTSPLESSSSDTEESAAPFLSRKPDESDVDFEKRRAKAADERESSFLSSKKEAEEGSANDQLAHAPYWPEERKPGWWVMICDQKVNKIIVPPTRVTDVPYCDTATDFKADRLFKLQFQAPPQVGSYGFQVHFVSDSFLWDDIRRNITLEVEDFSALPVDEQGAEDEISDPGEDTIAGQMANLRGGSVKRSTIYGGGEDDDDDESTTDGDQSSSSSSDSDSDSD